MEPFTHALTSLALARTGQRHLPRFGPSMLIVSGLAPDLDYASYFAGPGAFLQIHRAALHSVAGAAVAACAVAGAFCALDKKFPRENSPQKKSFPPLTFGTAVAVSAAGAAGHVLLDLASGVGVQLLWPLHAHWYGWELTTNLDLWILLLLVAGLLLPMLFRLINEEVGQRKKNSGSGAGIVTLCLMLAYFGGRAFLHSRATDLLLSREYHGRFPLSAGAFPTSSGPFNWRGLAVTDTTIEEEEVALMPGQDFDADRSLTHYKPEDSPALDAAQNAPAARKFLAYARFPLANVQRLEDGYRVEVRDLRFASDDADLANIFVRVDLDSGLRVVRQEFHFASAPNP